MCSSLSASRWVFLLVLAAAMLYSISEGQSNLNLSCCHNLGNGTLGRIIKCFEQKPRRGCKINAFVIVKTHNRIKCIRPDSPWIKEKLAKGLSCPPDVSFPY